MCIAVILGGYLTSCNFGCIHRNRNCSKYLTQREFILKNWMHRRWKAEKPTREKWDNSQISHSKKLKTHLKVKDC